MTTTRTQLGNSGEALARTYLERHGLVFIEDNWRCLSGEIDLVMSEGDETVFVEVKTRVGEGAGRAEEAISPRKRDRLLRSAEWFIDHRELEDSIWRIDLVAITLDRAGMVVRLTHRQNVVVTG